MADHDDDVVVVAASFLYFFNEENANAGLHHCILLHTSVKCRIYLFLLL